MKGRHGASLNPKALGCFTRVLVQCILFSRISAALLKSPRLGQKKLISTVLEKSPDMIKSTKDVLKLLV